MNRVFVKVKDGIVVDIASDAFLSEEQLTEWIQIDEGDGDRYRHAQFHYLGGSIYTEDGIPFYRFSDGEIAERTADEIETERASFPVQKSYDDDIEELREALEMLLNGVTE